MKSFSASFSAVGRSAAAGSLAASTDANRRAAGAAAPFTYSAVMDAAPSGARSQAIQPGEKRSPLPSCPRAASSGWPTQ